MSRDIDHAQASEWAKVRDFAVDALPLDGAYTIAVGAQVHRVTSLGELARVTRRERARYGVEWPEDPGAKPARRWE